MPLARFLYGVSAGCGVGWLLLTFLDDGVARLLVLGAASALAAALLFHQKVVRQSRGRRWRRTPRHFDLG